MPKEFAAVDAAHSRDGNSDGEVKALGTEGEATVDSLMQRYRVYIDGQTDEDKFLCMHCFEQQGSLEAICKHVRAHVSLYEQV